MFSRRGVFFNTSSVRLEHGSYRVFREGSRPRHIPEDHSLVKNFKWQVRISFIYVACYDLL